MSAAVFPIDIRWHAARTTTTTPLSMRSLQSRVRLLPWPWAGLLTCLLSVFLLVAFRRLPAHAAGSPGAVSTAPTSICSHRAAQNGDTQPPSTAAEYATSMRALAASGILCYDVDVTPFGGARAADGSVPHGVGHPTAFTHMGANGVVSGGGRPATLQDFFDVLKSLPSGASATLEVKGALVDDARFAAFLVSAARAAGVLGQISVQGVAPAVAPPGLTLSIALKDRPEEDGSVCGGVMASGGGGEAAAVALANVLSAYDVVCPSVKCVEIGVVRDAISVWSNKRGREEGRRPSGPAIGTVQMWIVDDAQSALRARSSIDDGARLARFVSNEPMALARALEKVA